MLVNPSLEQNFYYLHFWLHTQVQNCTCTLVMGSPNSFLERCKNLQQALLGCLVLRNFPKLLRDVGASCQAWALIIVFPQIIQWKWNLVTPCRDGCTDLWRIGHLSPFLPKAFSVFCFTWAEPHWLLVLLGSSVHSSVFLPMSLLLPPLTDDNLLGQTSALCFWSLLVQQTSVSPRPDGG